MTTEATNTKVERFSGDMEDADEFQLRFKNAAGDRGYLDVYRGTAPKQYGADAIALFTDTSPAELAGTKAEKQAAGRRHDRDVAANDGLAYRFVLQSLDGTNALQLARDVPDEDDAGNPLMAVARPAYLQMRKKINDGSPVQLSRMLLELARLRCGDGEDPTATVRRQQALYLKVKAAGC